MQKFYTKLAGLATAENPLTFITGKGMKVNSNSMSLRFEETPLATLSVLTNEMAAPFDDGKLYVLSRIRSVEMRQRDAANIEGDIETVEGFKEAIKGAVSDIVKSDVTYANIDAVSAQFAVARTYFRRALDICVRDNDIDSIDEMVREISRNFLADSQNEAFYAEAIEFVSMAHYAISELRFKYPDTHPNYKKFQGWQLGESLEGSPFVLEGDVAAFITDVNSGKFFGRDPFLLALAEEVKDIDELNQLLKNYEDIISSLREHSYRDEVKNSREVGYAEVGMVGPGEGLGFSDLRDANVAVVLTAPSGDKVGINYTNHNKPEMIAQAYAILEKKCKNLDPATVKVTIVGGYLNGQIHEVKKDTTSFEDSHATLAEKIGESGALVADVVKFAREKGMQFTNCCLFLPNSPSSFVINEKGITAGRAEIVSPDAENKRMLILTGIVDPNLMNVPFRSLKDPFKPIILSPHFKGEQGFTFVGLIAAYVTMLETKFNLHREFHKEGKNESVSTVTRIAAAISRTHEQLMDVIQPLLTGITQQFVYKDGISMLGDSTAQFDYNFVGSKGLERGRLILNNVAAEIITPMFSQARSGQFAIAIGEREKGFNSHVSNFVTKVNGPSKKLNQGAVIVVRTPEGFRFDFNNAECARLGNRMIVQEVAKHCLEPHVITAMVSGNKPGMAHAKAGAK